jgi:hypothetical protein
MLKYIRYYLAKSRVEAVYNTSTVALRVAEGNEMDPGAWGHNWATLSLGDINTETWSSMLGGRIKG